MEMKGYQAGISDFTGSDSVVFGISTDELDENRRFAEELELDFALLSDAGGEVARQYGGMMERFPTAANRVTYVVGKDGRIAYIGEGAEAMNPAGARDACLGLD